MPNACSDEPRTIKRTRQPAAGMCSYVRALGPQIMRASLSGPVYLTHMHMCGSPPNFACAGTQVNLYRSQHACSAAYPYMHREVRATREIRHLQFNAAITGTLYGLIRSRVRGCIPSPKVSARSNTHITRLTRSPDPPQVARSVGFGGMCALGVIQN